MAEVNISSNSKKKILNVDLTPMVDLGFLLIGFFMYTTTLTNPTAMRLNAPDRHKSDVQTPAASTLTLYLDSLVVHYAEGTPGTKPLQVAYLDHSPSIAQEIRAMQQRLDQAGGPLTRNDLTVLIKAGNSAPYDQVIKALDQMTILGVKRYMLLDQDPADEALVKAK